MMKVLQADPLELNPIDYYNEEKNVFDTIPVFPLLSEREILKAIYESVDQSELFKEIQYLRENRRLVPVIDSQFAISLLSWEECPNIIQLLTIIREWAFRNEGGGVGCNDFDEFDLLPEMKQLVIIDTVATEVIGAIVGGYRYMIHHYNSYSTGPVGAHFQFSEKWKNETWIELGRSFINPYFQLKNQRKSFDLVLHGLGYIHAKNPMAKGYFGKITLYKVYELQKADAYFLSVSKNYMQESKDMYVDPAERVPEGSLTTEQTVLLDRDVFKGLFYSLRTDYKINLVPIMAIYNRLTDLSKIYYCGAFRHRSFGDSIEMGIAIDFDDIYEIIEEKFVSPYR